ncbi:MAG: hypothetical protein U9P42_04795 [Candidatus Fermentibacteria bacterium]|nr:hypothetical protein [Candidatus Fermentibacteria bacterium]
MVKEKKPVSSGQKQNTVPFSNINYILFAAGLIIITAGWFLLRAGHISISPIMLILGYCVIIPVAIILKPGDKKEKK